MLRAAIVVTFVMITSAALAAEAKITLYYGQPKSADEFDKYYYEKHLPRLYAVKALKKVEISRPVPTPDGKPPATYLITLSRGSIGSPPNSLMNLSASSLEPKCSTHQNSPS